MPRFLTLPESPRRRLCLSYWEHLRVMTHRLLPRVLLGAHRPHRLRLQLPAAPLLGSSWELARPLKLSPPGAAVTRPVGAASPELPPVPPGAAPLPLEHLERGLQGASQRSAPRQSEAWRRAPLHLPTLALSPRVGSESLGVDTRPAHEYADPRWSVPGPGNQGDRIPGCRHVGTAIGLRCGCAPKSFARNSA